MSSTNDVTLRSTKKQRTRSRILACAVTAFRREGVRGTRLADVASAGEVSIASLYNYFPTKSALAGSWLRGELADALTQTLEEGRVRGRGLRAELRGAARRLARAAALEPALRREAWCEAGRSASPELVPPSALVEALTREQQGERVRADMPASLLASLLVDAIEGGLIEGLREAATPPAGDAEGAKHVEERGAERAGKAAGDRAEATDPAARARRLESAIRARLDLVLDGARKRNERVRAPARATLQPSGAL